jgi:hypothetical protein
MSSINLALPETSEGYRSLVESFNLGTESGQQAYVTMLKLSDSADEYYTNLEDSQQKALDIQVSIINKTISAYQGLSNALSSTLNSIMGTGQASSISYMAAQANISGALTGAQAGKIPELSSIQDSLSIVSQNSATSYDSLQSYQRDQMATAGMVDELLGYTNDAVSVQDMMLSELQGQTVLMGGAPPTTGYVPPLAQPRATISSSTTAQNSDIQRSFVTMSDEIKGLRKQIADDNVKIISNTFNSADTLDNWDVVGMPEVRV